MRSGSSLLHNTLHNTTSIELWPARLLRARSNLDARILARAHTVLRRKRDGRYVAAALPEGMMGLMPAWSRQPGIDEAMDRLESIGARPARIAGLLPLDNLQARLDLLGLDAQDYAAASGLSLIAEPAVLSLAGLDRYRRPLWLGVDAARAWRAMQRSARQAGIALDSVSGYRSHDYQLGIFERKLARGQSVDAILTVNAAPGFSEHHSGEALDIGTPGEPPAEESFERTTAFAWLTAHAGEFGFCMSYPRGNPHGIVYEPWHWRHHTPAHAG
jgi:D-alanyl-D-alanine carboxypeptidase